MDGTIPLGTAARGAEPHRRRSAPSTACGRQHLPRRRRQPASADPLRRQRRRRRRERAEQAGAEILKLCVEVGGCLTGEHGVGIEKRDLMRVQFTDDRPRRADAHQDACSIRKWLLNPAKVFPLDGARGRASVGRGPGGLRRAALSDLHAPRRRAGSFSACIAEAAPSDALPIEIVGAGSKRAIGRPGRRHGRPSTTASLRGITLYEPNELVMSARAGTPLSQIEAELAARGQMLPFEPIDLGPRTGGRRARRHHRRRVRHQPVRRAAHPRRRGARPSARRRGRQRPRRDLQVRRPRDEERHRLRRLRAAWRAAGARSRC